MSYSIQDANTDLEGVLHGTTTNQIEGLFALYNRAARQLLLDIDPQETKRTVEFTVPIFNGVTYYPLAADVKGNRLIDIRPQVQRDNRDIWTQKYNQEFDVMRQNSFAGSNMFTMNFNTGVKSILINAPYLTAPVVQNNADTITGNGTWAVGGSASSLAVDNQNYVNGAGSLKFNLPSGAGYLENSTMSQLDLTTYLNQGTLFLWVYMPTASQFTSVNLKWGSDSSNYYGVTVTTTQAGTAFQNGWNLLAFPWLGNTTVGTPTVTAIDYLKVTFNTTAAQTGAHLNYITVSLGTYMEYEYYSKYLFRDATTGAFKEKVTTTSDLINLDTETYNLFFNLSASLAVQQQQGVDALFYDGNFFAQKYAEGVAKYKLLYKSEAQKPQTTYYAKPNTSNRKYFGRWSNN